MKYELMLIQKSSHALSFYDVDSGQEKNRIDFPEFPHEFVVDGENRYAYVGHYGVYNSASEEVGGNEVYVVDIATRKIVHTLSCTDHRRPHGIGMDKLGRLYALSESTATLLVKKNPRQGGVFDYGVSTGGKKSHLFAITSQGDRAYSMNLNSNDVTVLAPHDSSIAPISVKTGEKPEGRHLRDDEKVLFVTNRGDNNVSVVDTQSLKVISQFSTPQDPTRIFHDTQRNHLLTTNYGGNSLSFYEGSSGKEIHRLETESPPIALSLSPDWNYAFLSVDNDSVLMVSLEDFQVIRQYHTLKEPDVSYLLPIEEN